MMQTFRRSLWVVSYLVLMACAKTPITGDKVFILTSESEEAKLGQDAYQQILRKSQISNNRAWTEIL